MAEMIRAALVRMRRESDQQVVGVGFLVSNEKKTILTCAHVVNAALESPDNTDKPRALIRLDFPFIDIKHQLDTRVIHFFPKTPDGTDDIAILEIIDDLPEGAASVQLAAADTYNGQEFGVYGFPQGFEENGQYVEGKLQERLVNERIQAVGTSNFGYFVEQGFSGSPVYGKELNAVVGMVVQVDVEPEKRVAFIIPPDVVAEKYPDLTYKKIEQTAKSAAGTAASSPSGKWLQRVDIFISSPSDVAEEREAVVRVIERLNRLSYIRSRYVLNPLLYEKEVPPEAGDHAQMIVDRYMAVEDSYLLVCLMWNRMGTPITHPHTGEKFRSGTEYEFTVGYLSHEKNGQPHLLLYRKTAENPGADESEKDKVENFFKRFEGNGATFKGLYKQFSSLGEFENMLFEHIERILHDNPPDADRSGTRVDPATRSDIIEEARRLDAAMPRECQVGRSTEVRVMICLPDSEGLRTLLPDYTAEGDLIDKRDVREGYLAVAFPLDKATGLPKPIMVSVEVKTYDFALDDPVQEIQLSPNRNSGLLSFWAKPLHAARRGRVHVIVKSKTPDGYVIVLGSAPLDSDIKAKGAKLVAQALWAVLSVPLATMSLESVKPQQGATTNAFRPEDYLNRGLTYSNLGKYEQAIQDFDRALALDPQDPSSYRNRWQSYMAPGQHERAIADFDTDDQTSQIRFFINSSRSDALIAKEIVKILQSSGYEIWIDDMLSGGKNWWNEIERIIRECNGMIYLLSPDSVKSEWCAQELDMALDLKKVVIPILVRPDAEIPESLSHINYLDMTRGNSPQVTAALLSAVAPAVSQTQRKALAFQQLIAQLGSSSNDVTLQAISELRTTGHLTDGTLQRVSLVGANLQNADFSSAILNGASFVVASLRASNFQFAQLPGASFYRADLEMADLNNADLTKCAFNDANLKGTLLTGAILIDSSFTNATLSSARFDETTILPDGTYWTANTNLLRFTDANHPEYWRPVLSEGSISTFSTRILQESHILEQVLIQILDERGLLADKRQLNLGQLLESLHNAEIDIPQGYIEILDRFSELRNRTAHSAPQDTDDIAEVEQILESIQPVVDWLQKLPSTTPVNDKTESSRSDIISQTMELLVPFMMNHESRQMQVVTAFSDTSILNQISYSGSARDFTLRLVQFLDRYGEVEQGKPALVILLESLREHVGDGIQSEIDRLIADLTR